MAGKKMEKQMKDLEKKFENEQKKYEKANKKATDLEAELKTAKKVGYVFGSNAVWWFGSYKLWNIYCTKYRSQLSLMDFVL